MDNDNTDRNNVVLLIVIAIATMIIVVVGATFAYFADKVENEAQANITGTTNGNNGNDIFVLDGGNGLSLQVSDDNLIQNGSDAIDSTIASITVAGVNQSSTHKYNMSLTIAVNDFEYTSGKCYYKNTSNKLSNSKEECQNNLWARSYDELDYSCYSLNGANYLDLGDNNDEVTCNHYGNTIWAQEEIPELVIDVYSENKNLDKNSCTKEIGVCIKEDGTALDASSESECIQGTWISNVYERDKCFSYTKRVDVTEIKGDLNKKIPLLTDKEIISSKGETVTDYYLVTVKMLNLSHNQNVNKGKNFVGNLILSVEE